MADSISSAIGLNGRLDQHHAAITTAERLVVDLLAAIEAKREASEGDAWQTD